MGATPTCEALDWVKADHDYVQCSGIQSIRRYRLEGIMLAVEVDLCDGHANYFKAQPPGWRSVIVTQCAAPARARKEKGK